MAIDQEYKERRVNSLPNSGLSAGDKYALNVGGGKYQTYVVSDTLQLVKEAGAEFIEKDTMADLRALSAREIWALQNGYYKGVKLNGYYTKGDTPAPIDYYLSTTSNADDDGFIISIGGIKLEHKPLEKVDMLYYGIKEGEYVDIAFLNALKYTNDNLTIEFPTTKTSVGFKFNSTKEIRGKIKGNKTRITFDSRQASYFQQIGDCEITGFIAEATHSSEPTFENVPNFLYKNTSSDRTVISNNNIKNLRINITVSSDSTYSKNVIIEDNVISCDFTGFPIYAIQNDIITVYNGENVFIRRNVIKGIHTNRCLKISSSSTNGMLVLSSNIHINDNVIDLDGSTDPENNSKQLLDLYQNSFNVYIYNNKIKSRGYTHIFENKSSSSFSVTRFMHIYKNNIDVDLCSIYREVGNYGNITQIGSTGKVRTILEENDITITGSKEGDMVFVMQTIGVDYIDLINNYIQSKDSVVLLVNSNCRKSTYLNNIFENVITRNTFSSNNGMGDSYEAQWQNIMIRDNYFYYSVAVPAGNTFGATEVRANNPKVTSFKVVDNIFENIVTNSLFRPIHIISSEVLNIIAVNNQSNMGAPIFNPTNVSDVEVSDYNNSWISLSDRKSFYRITLSSSNNSISPRRGFLMYDLVGSANASIVIDKSILPNNGGMYVFRNSTTSNTLTLTQGTDVVFPSTTLAPGESATFITYGNNQYRLVIQSPKNASTSVKGLVNQAIASADTATPASGPTPTKEEFDDLLAELRDWKNKARTAGYLQP